MSPDRSLEPGYHVPYASCNRRSKLSPCQLLPAVSAKPIRTFVCESKTRLRGSVQGELCRDGSLCLGRLPRTARPSVTPRHDFCNSGILGGGARIQARQRPLGLGRSCTSASARLKDIKGKAIEVRHRMEVLLWTFRVISELHVRNRHSILIDDDDRATCSTPAISYVNNC